MSDVKNVLYEDFSLGLDTSRGVMSRDARKFLQLQNYLVNTSKQLERRAPCSLIAGQRPGNTQGCLYLNGRFVTIAKAGGLDPYPSPNVNSLDLLLEDGTNLLLEDGGFFLLEGSLALPLTVLYFDNPEYCTSWELLDLLTFNEQVCALIRHTFLGSTITERLMLHVWDDTRPTWVDDPFVPTNWSKTFPLHAYGAGTLGAVQTYTPVMTTSGDKLFISGPDGNTRFSATNKPRVWNDRTAQEILADGRWWYWISPAAAPAGASVTVPADYNDFVSSGAYAAYVLEVCQSNGAWAQLREGFYGPGGYVISYATNRFDSAKPSELVITFRCNADSVVRFRALAKPALTITAGEYLTPAGNIVSGSQIIEGSAEQVATVPAATVLSGLADGTAYLIAAVSSKAPGFVSLPSVYAGSSTSMPLNGQQRYWSRLIGATSTLTPASGGFAFDFTGTVTSVVGSTKLTGTGTSFLTQARVGDQIEFNGERRVVASVSTDLALEVTVAFTTAATGACARDIRYRYANEIGDTGNAWYAAREAEATFTLAGAANAGFINTSLYDNSGGRPVCLAPGQNRLFVQYFESVQMWQTDPNPANMSLLAVSQFGAGPNTMPRAALVDGLVAMPTFLGPRLFRPDGLNKDYIHMIPIGDVFRRDDLPAFSTAAWWASERTLVMSANTGGTFYCFHYHPDYEIQAWSTWNVAGLTITDRIFAVDGKLYVSSGLLLYAFDADATVYRDSSDGATAYASHALWLYNDLGTPARNKHLVRFEIQQQGTCQVTLRTTPSSQGDVVNGPPAAQGYTQGLAKAPLAIYTPAVGLEITSTDETGHVLSAIGFDYRLSAR